jgi:ATP synthase protein I
VEEGDGALARYAGVGIQFAAAVILFLFAGQWLDRRLGTSPVFLMLGVFVGAGAAFYSMYRKLMADQEARKKDKRPGQGGGQR